MKKVIILVLSLISFSSFASQYDDLKNHTLELAAKTLISYKYKCEREVDLCQRILSHHFTILKIQDENMRLISLEKTPEVEANIKKLGWIINLNKANLDMQFENLKNSNCSNDRFFTVMQNFEDEIVEFNKARIKN